MDEEAQEFIDAAQSEGFEAPPNIDILVRDLSKLRDQYDELKDQLKKVTEAIDAIEGVLIEQFKLQGIKSARTEGGA